MVRLTRIYTKTGDKGKTSLGNTERVDKYAPRVNVVGTVDEANSMIGIARLETAALTDKEPDAILARIQNDLFDVGADLCVPNDGVKPAYTPLRVTPHQVKRLEQEIDRLNKDVAPLSSFVLPGGAPAAAYLYSARAIIRRAEREGWLLAAEESVSPEVLKYLNRLSDHLFVLARWINTATKVGDVLWKPGATG